MTTTTTRTTKGRDLPRGTRPSTKTAAGYHGTGHRHKPEPPHGSIKRVWLERYDRHLQRFILIPAGAEMGGYP